MTFLVMTLFFINISLYCVGLVLFSIASEFLTFNLALLGSNIVLSLCLYMLKREYINRNLKTRFMKNIFIQISRFILVFAILGLINFIILKKDITSDFTSTKLNSLTDTTSNRVKLVKSNAEFILFAKREDWGKFTGLLRLFSSESKFIKSQFIDVELEPAMASLYSVTESGTLVIKYQGREKQGLVKDELSILNILNSVLKDKKQTIYYVSEHNELDFNSSLPIGGSHYLDSLKSEGIYLKEVSLENELGENIKNLLIIDPKTNFTDLELKNLKQYLDRGSNLLTALSPIFKETNESSYTKLLRNYGISFVNSLVLDTLSSQEGGRPSVPVIKNYNIDHDLLRGFKGRTLFPISGFFDLSLASTELTSLIYSNSFPAAWGEVNFEEVKTGVAKFTENEDYKGPLSLAVAIEREDQKILAFSSGAFFQNQFDTQSENNTLGVNVVRWMLGEERIKDLKSKKSNRSIIYLSDINLSFIFYFTVLFIPFLFFILAIILYRRGQLK